MLKTVGTNGQISLSRKYAGQHFALEEEDGVITLTPLREVPESQDGCKHRRCGKNWRGQTPG